MILSSAEVRIKRKIEEAGKPLKDWEVNIYRGILTGFNEAFIIDGKTRNDLITKSPEAAEIIHPILRGRDIKKYKLDFSDNWLIFTRHGVNIDQYNAIKEHLHKYYTFLLPKIGGVETGRKPGSYQWYEIQDNIAYYKELCKPKIIYPEITKFLPFVYDEKEYYLNNKTFFMVGNKLKYLVAFFNSSIFKAVLKHNFPDLGEDRRELRKVFFEQIKVIEPSIIFQSEIEKLVDMVLIQKGKSNNTEKLEQKIDLLFYKEYHLTDDEITLINTWATI